MLTWITFFTTGTWRLTSNHHLLINVRKQKSRLGWDIVPSQAEDRLQTHRHRLVMIRQSRVYDKDVRVMSAPYHWWGVLSTENVCKA